MGAKAGFVPEGDLRSVVRMQNELAASHSRERGLARLIWIPPDLVPVDSRQAKLIEMIEADASAQEGADVLRTSLEDLKSIIRDRLRQPETAKETEPVGQDPDWVQIYLVCDQCDFERIQPLADHLYGGGFEVVFPVFEGDETEVREDHIDKLATSEVVLLYQGEASDLWLSSKLRDLRKLPSYEGYKPKLATAIYLGPPESPSKKTFRTREAQVIKVFDEFEPDHVEPLLVAVKEAREGKQ
jgi:hypothetical protein